jgi:hypothetical protein
MFKKWAGITQNGYITVSYDIVGFVARNLLYKALYMAFQTRWKITLKMSHIIEHQIFQKKKWSFTHNVSLVLQRYFNDIPFEREKFSRHDELI